MWWSGFARDSTSQFSSNLDPTHHASIHSTKKPLLSTDTKALKEKLCPVDAEWVWEEQPLLLWGDFSPSFQTLLQGVQPQESQRGRVSLVRITALRLEGLQLDDQGLYECRILLLDQPKDELQNGTWTLLSVT
ncbi:unnamed protein product, partial [Lampetra planeri]